MGTISSQNTQQQLLPQQQLPTPQQQPQRQPLPQPPHIQQQPPPQQQPTQPQPIQLPQQQQQPRHGTSLVVTIVLSHMKTSTPMRCPSLCPPSTSTSNPSLSPRPPTCTSLSRRQPMLPNQPWVGLSTQVGNTMGSMILPSPTGSLKILTTSQINPTSTPSPNTPSTILNTPQSILSTAQNIHHLQPSTVLHQLSTVLRRMSTVHQKRSTVHQKRSTVHQTRSTVHQKRSRMIVLVVMITGEDDEPGEFKLE